MRLHVREGVARRLESASESDFKRIGSSFLSTSQYAYEISDADMIKEFSATSLVLKLLYKDLVLAGLPTASKPLHLLWWLYYTKHYPKKKMWERLSRRSYKTTKKWMHIIRKAIMVVVPDMIKWENRLRKDKGRSCKTYHDGVDCRINSPAKKDKKKGKYPFDECWYGHKFKKAGLRYGIATCIQTGEIVLVQGPFPAGAWPDQKIYTQHVVPKLSPGEKVEADRGYRHPTIRRPENFDCRSEKKAKGAVAGRHETINGRLKNFASLDERYRHDIKEHKYYFYTACVMYNLMHRQYGPTFDVYY